MIWSEAELRFVLLRRVEHPFGPVPLPWRETGTGRYQVDIPSGALTGHKQVLLRVRYSGDVGHAFAGNELISDHFCNGGVWDIRLDPYARALEQAPLTLYLTPVRKFVTVDTSAMAGLTERAETSAAELIGAELVTVDDYTVDL
jgi:hypothetical protein